MNNSIIFFIILITTFTYASIITGSDEALITQFAELQKAMGKDSNEISVSVAKVSSGIQQNNINYNTLQDGFKQRCDSGFSVLNNYIQDLQKDDTSSKLEITASQELISQSQTDMQSYKKEIADLKKQCSASKILIAQTMANIKKYAIEADSKLIVIKSISNIILDEITNAPLRKGTSFLQLNTEEFKLKIENLKTILSETESHETLLAPMALTLLEIARSNNFADQAILKKILEILAQLSKNLKAFRKNQQTVQFNNVKLMKAARGEKKKQMRSFINLHGNANSTVIFNKSHIEDVNRQITANSQIITRKISEKTYWSNACAYEEKVRQIAIKSSREFSDVVSKITTRLLDL